MTKEEKQVIKSMLDKYEKPRNIKEWILQKIIHKKVQCAYCGESYLSRNGIWIKIYGFKNHNQKQWLCDTICFDSFYEETRLVNKFKIPINPLAMQDLKSIRLGS